MERESVPVIDMRNPMILKEVQLCDNTLLSLSFTNTLMNISESGCISMLFEDYMTKVPMALPILIFAITSSIWLPFN